MRGWLRRLGGAELGSVAVVAGFLLLVSGAPLAVSMAIDPAAIDRGEVRLTPPCSVKARTGEACPTCGLTRGFCAMSRLRVADAAAYHAGAPGLYGAVLSVALLSAWMLALATLEGKARLRRRRAVRAAR